MNKRLKNGHILFSCLILILCAFLTGQVSAAPIEIRDNIPCPFENPNAYQPANSIELPSTFEELLVSDTAATMKTLLQDDVRISCGLGVQGYTISYWAASAAEPEVSHPWMYVQAALMHDTLVDHIEDSAPIDEGYGVISVQSQDAYTVPSGTYYVIGCHQGELPNEYTYHTHTQTGTLYVGP
ncbi:hypothetical protein J2741_000239 [Methanolinea mesophila]|uniref:hypothetical protein n=1 Tax=Methanolinea mesophila TaxID=547055 RepID=UPI001AE5AD79|nr:hypothetical protein [Methanolinea mesophila]MBP1927692.1 hypothetical protein [Methanolinea mesophila]